MILLAQATVPAVPFGLFQIIMTIVLMIIGAMGSIVVGFVLKRQDTCEDRDRQRSTQLAAHDTELALLKQEIAQLRSQLSASRKTNEILERQTKAMERICDALART